MAPPPRRSKWLLFRRLFKWLRIAMGLALLACVAVIIHLATVGLPKAAQARLSAELRKTGIEMNADRIRLNWTGGVIAENVQLAEASIPNPAARLAAAEVGIDLDLAALRKRSLRIEALRIRNGELKLALHETNQPPRSWSATGFQAVLRFSNADFWELDRCEARAFGGRLFLSGSVTNADAARQAAARSTKSQIPAAERAAQLSALRLRFRKIVETIEGMEFASPPELRLLVHSDAAMPTNTHVRLNFHAPQAITRWGNAANLMAAIDWGRAESDRGDRRSTIELSALSVSNASASATGLLFQATGFTPPGELWPISMSWTARCDSIASTWLHASPLRLQGASQRTNAASSGLEWSTALQLEPGLLRTPWATGEVENASINAQHNASPPLRFKVLAATAFEKPVTRWGTAAKLALKVQASRPGQLAEQPPDPAWGWWEPARDFDANWNLEAHGLDAQGVQIERFNCDGEWRAPRLQLSRVEALLHGGSTRLQANLDVASRRVHGEGKVAFDVHRIASVLGPGGRKWLSQYAWEQPPNIRAAIDFTLPPWSQTNVNWKRDIEPSMALEGEFSIDKGAFRGVSVLSAASSLSFSNRAWRLPNLHATRTEGRVLLDYWCDTVTQDYSWDIDSSIDPRVIGSLFGDGTSQALGYFDFTTPPEIRGVLHGRWQAPERIGFEAVVRGSNFSFRGESVSGFEAATRFTNRVMAIRDVTLKTAAGEARVPRALYDLAANAIHLTNAACAIDPLVVARMIGPDTAKVLVPYRFSNAPSIQVDGTVYVGASSSNDLRFAVRGGPFSYWRFNLPEIAADLHWFQDTLSISNLQAAFYRGRLDAGFHFNFAVPEGADFSFQSRVVDVDLHEFMVDMSGPTNKLEGTLAGELNVTSANSANWKSWEGSGNASLSDGFLWSMPLMGMLSKPFDTVFPGIASSRFNSGTATFTIRKSLIHSDDLELHSGAMRLDYQGTVDFDANLDARVEAQILRDTAILGQIFGAALFPLTKLLEYKITGTLGKPTAELMHIPKLLLFPLRPLRMIRGIFNDPKKEEPEKSK